MLEISDCVFFLIMDIFVIDGVYQQIAVHFAYLHDTPGRMQVMRRQVDWAESRVFFYYRLKRRLTEFAVVNAVNEVFLY